MKYFKTQYYEKKYQVFLLNIRENILSKRNLEVSSTLIPSFEIVGEMTVGNMEIHLMTII
jgi:hypothetical protein